VHLITTRTGGGDIRFFNNENEDNNAFHKSWRQTTAHRPILNWSLEIIII